MANRKPRKIKGSGTDKIKVIISMFEVMFVLCGIVEIISVCFEKYFRSIRNSLSEMISN